MTERAARIPILHRHVSPHVPSAAGKQIPTELRADAEALKAAADLDDDRTAVPRVSVSRCMDYLIKPRLHC